MDSFENFSPEVVVAVKRGADSFVLLAVAETARAASNNAARERPRARMDRAAMRGM